MMIAVMVVTITVTMTRAITITIPIITVTTTARTIMNAMKEHTKPAAPKKAPDPKPVKPGVLFQNYQNQHHNCFFVIEKYLN